MECPKCKLDMEYEEIKFPSGEWYCEECDDFYYGERFGVDARDGIDYEEKIGRNINDLCK